MNRDSQVTLTWIYGDNFNNVPRPTRMGGHMVSSWHTCDFKRSLIAGGAPLSVTVSESELTTHKNNRFGHKRCVEGTAPGRWLWLGSRECEPPFCSGSHRATITGLMWCVESAARSIVAGRNQNHDQLPGFSFVFLRAFQDGATHRSWVWVPYTCYYHLFSAQDMYTCAAEAGVRWIHGVGDSQVRPFVVVLELMSGADGPKGKFKYADFMMGSGNQQLRVSWQFFWHFLIHDGTPVERTLGMTLSFTTITACAPAR